MKNRFYLKMVSLMTVLALTGCEKADEVKLKHFYEEDVEMITDLSPEEQKIPKLYEEYSSKRQ